MEERDSTIENILQEIRAPYTEPQDSDFLPRNSLFTRTEDTRRYAGRETLRRSSDLQGLRQHVAQLSETNLHLQDTVDSLRNQCLLYEQEVEQGNAERSSLLDYLSHFRSEHQRVEAKLEAYTERMKRLEQANALLEQRLQEQQELMQVREKEHSQVRAQLHCSQALTQLDLNLGPPESTRRERVSSARNCKQSVSPKRKKTPAAPRKKERLTRAETPRCGKLPRSSSTRKGLCE